MHYSGTDFVAAQMTRHVCISPESTRNALFEQCISHRSRRIVILMLLCDFFLYKYPTRAAQPPHCNIQSFSPKNTSSSLPKFLIINSQFLFVFYFYDNCEVGFVGGLLPQLWLI